MCPRKRLSRQDIIRSQQRSTFVGRVQQLESFEHNLSHLLRAEDGTPYPEAFLFNVWGQGGVGKTTLLKRFEDIAKRYGAVVALTDEAIESAPEVMAEFARQLEAQGKPLKQFDERYKVFRQKRKELETDPEAPQGFSAFVGKTAARVGFSLGRQVPGAGGVIEDFIDEKAVVDSAGEWAAFVTRKLKNKDEIQLVNEPDKVLTPLFLEDLGEIVDCQIVLLFDTYERTDEVLEQWLLEVAAERYGGLPLNCIWTIAGREQLNPNRWSSYAPESLAISPFTEAEAVSFLQQKGITNAAVIEKIVDLSERLPLMLAILAESASNEMADFEEASGTAVERFLKWVDDPKKRTLAMEAALLQRLNRDSIALLVGENQSEALFSWLTAMPFVRERSDGWVYHDVVRPQMLRYQRKISSEQWTQRHLKIADYYKNKCLKLGLEAKEQYKDSDWQDYALNQIYHQLCSHPQRELLPALSQFLQALKHKREFAQRWATVIERAGSDVDNRDVHGWGKQLSNGLKSYEEDQYDKMIAALKRLSGVRNLEVRDQAVILAWQGELHRLKSDCESALENFNSAIGLDSEYKWAIASRGETHQTMKCYDEAIDDFSRAIKIDSEYKWAIASRGETYRLMKRYDEAIDDFSRAINIDPQDEWAITLRGATYQLMKRYGEAIDDFNHAIKIDPEYSWAIASRGQVYRATKRYDEALTDFNCAINIDPEYKWAIGQKGETYLLTHQYQQALQAFDTAIAIDPQNDWRFFFRALSQFALSDPKQAKTDLPKAIEIATETYTKNNNDYSNTLNLALYHLTAQQQEKATHLYQQVLSSKASRHYIHMAITDLQDLLTIFPNYQQAAAMKSYLESSLTQPNT